ncbi:MAG TPA: hypothetical protein PLR74_12070, partial [Agriterribacter sp.]|nr:hypothetical protein [Agriterribacter sp.]
LPTGIDSGHPTLVAILLALAWKVFGVKIVVGHILMLPFIVLLIREAIRVCKHYFKNGFPYVAALVLLNPVILGQATLVSPDIVLFGFFFFTLNGILDSSKLKILIGSLVLGAISMRGMMCVAYLCLFAALRQGVSFQSIIKYALLFSPGILIVLTFLTLHYAHSGWIGYHANSPWADSFESAGIKGFARNIVVFLFRMVDMGMVFIWAFVGGAIIYYSKGSIPVSKRTKELLLLWILCFLVSVLLQFFYRHSLLHRYLLPLMAITILIFCSVAEERLSLKLFKRVWLFSLIGLLSGNLWVYPDPIAKGWDATLAHLPYYKLRKEALHFIKEKNIPLGDVNGGFPYNLTGKCIDLSSDTTTYSGLPPEQSPYVLYSNISNDYTDEQLRAFKEDWIPLKKIGGWPVRFVLYKNPSF